MKSLENWLQVLPLTCDLMEVAKSNVGGPPPFRRVRGGAGDGGGSVVNAM